MTTMPTQRALAAARRHGAVVALLATLTLVTFWPSLANDFVDWDDHVNLVKNAGYRGLGWAQIQWDFTNTTLGHYIPVTWLTFSLDYVLWGMDPFGYHLTNLLLHLTNVVLFYAVALRLLRHAGARAETTRRLGALVAALFFAIHPLRAESVAWVTERRDVLSGFFFLVTILLYLAASGAEGRRRSWLLGGAAAAYAAALGSKSSVMTLPLVLVILDVYPLRRLTFRRPPSRAVLMEKIPFVALAGLGAAVSFYAVYSNRFLTSLDLYPWPARIAMGFYSVWFYVTATLLPFGLSPVYELPKTLDPFAPRFLWPAIGVTAVTVAVVLGRRRWPWAAAAWLAYATVLAPVSGVIHAGHQLAHDRYSYLSCLPWALLLGGGVVALGALTASGRIRRPLAMTAGGALGAWLLILAALTWQQVQVWRDTQTLWTYAVDSEPDCAVCHANLGIHVGNGGNLGPAIAHLQRSVALRPERSRTHTHLALFLLKLDRRADALRHLDVSLRLEPNHPDTLTVLGVLLLTEGRTAAAVAPLRHALSLEPDHVLARTNFGTALARLGDDASAMAEYTRAIGTDPATAPPRYSLARLLARRGDLDGALAQYAVVKRLDPWLGEALGRQLQEYW
jgi:Flp pilus assembly protein TadD